uniref:Harmonin-binding protein USHBP1 PDZ-binding domain-containing protein n=1 Tax=Romanomermis culicivorax TaxID=13658 RepID=A0A915JXY8_ROMCU
MDQTKAQLNIMQASLSESKSYNENLSIICSQLESNQTALNLALEKANQIKEANDALLILIETQLAVFLANYRLSEAVDQELSMESLKDECQKLNVVSKMQRKRAVTVAMETLNKFNEHEHLLESNGIFEDKSSKDIFECEEKLKGHINRLQCEKDKIMATLLPVSTSLHDIIDKNSFSSESVTFSCNEEEGALGSDITKNLNSSAKTLNLENAIMQQELTKLKEERTDLRAQIFMIQKERELYVLTLLAKETELEACRIQNNYLSRKIENGNQIDKTSNVNHLVRKFTQTLDKLSAQIDYKSRQTETYISELKQANQSLLETIGKIRIKYEKESQRLKTEYKIKCNALESKVNDLQFTINSMIEKTAKKMYVNGQNVKLGKKGWSGKRDGQENGMVEEKGWSGKRDGRENGMVEEKGCEDIAIGSTITSSRLRKGDSGNPMVCLVRNNFYVTGVVFGVSRYESSATEYSIHFVWVPTYLPWIASILASKSNTQKKSESFAQPKRVKCVPFFKFCHRLKTVPMLG